MSAPIGVLAVMQAAINDFLVPTGRTYVEDLIQARAAVAELIEAAGGITGTVSDDGLVVSFDSLADLVTALILVNGGAG